VAPAERHVLVDRVDPEHVVGAVGGSVQLAHRPVAGQDRQRPVAPAALGSDATDIMSGTRLPEWGRETRWL